MTHTIKKLSIGIMVTVFAVTLCLPLFIMPSKVYADSVPYVIGDTGPAGGTIFYVDGSNCLEVAPGNQSINREDWSNVWSALAGTGTAIGTGASNTTAIIAQFGHTASAAKICRDYNGGGFTDWFLPSKDELNLMYMNLKVAGLGDFANDFYWSSSEINYELVRTQDFSDGFQDHPYYKNGSAFVRAIRAFSGMKEVGSSANKEMAEPIKEIWVRDHEMTCYQVWINDDNVFEFVFWWEYANNNWVKIYDMQGAEVFSIDMEKGNARFEADLPDGFYTVKTFHDGFETPIQEFLIGKP